MEVRVNLKLEVDHINSSDNDKIVFTTAITNLESRYVKDQTSLSNVTVTDIVIPERYRHELANYVEWLKSEQGISPTDIISSLEFAHWFEDYKYTEVLLIELFNHWTQLKDKLLDELHDDLISDVMLHCPHDLLFETYKRDNRFMKSWFEYDKNRKVTVDGNKVYYINKPDEDSTHLINCHSEGDIFTGPVTSFYNQPNPIVAYEATFLNNKGHGPYKRYSQAGFLEVNSELCNGNKHGQCLEYRSDTGELCARFTYVDGVLEGPAENHGNWDGDPTINVGMYHKGKKNGVGNCPTSEQVS